MPYVSSITEAGILQQLQSSQSVSTSTSGIEFSDILKQTFASMTEDMDAIFEEAASKYQVPVNLLKAVAKAESNFNSDAVSSAGAMGVMQLMPGTAQSLGVTDPFDARQNIMGGAKYLKQNLDKFGDVELALAAYNAGPGNVQKYGGIPPFKETQNYVSKITSYLSGGTLYANKTVTTGANSAVSAAIQAGGTGSAAAGSVGSYVSSYLNSLSGSGSLDSFSYLNSLTDSSGLGSYSYLNSLAGDSDLNYLSTLSGYSGLGSYSYLDSYLGLSDYTGIFSGMFSSQSGDTVTVDKDILSNLIQILRIQMMMNTDEEIGIL